MGVDYSAIFGIGVELDLDELHEILPSVYDDEDDDNTYLGERLDAVIENDMGIEFGEGGSACYGGPESWYIFIQDPFKDGYDITKKIKEFEDTLHKLGIKKFGKVDIVGDINIW